MDKIYKSEYNPTSSDIYLCLLAKVATPYTLFCGGFNMRFFPLSVVSLTLFALCSGYRCPTGGSRTYHAIVETDCQVYHLCENSQMDTLTCPSFQAFDHRTNECKDKSVVQCIETAPIHLHKRSIEEVRSVSFELLKSSSKELLKDIKKISKDTLQEILPTVYDRIEKEFVPVIESLKQEVEPFFYQKALPQLEKLYSYAKRMEVKILKKIYKSYELSNSTHLNVVSFDDVVEQIVTDLKPFLKIAKFISLKQIKNILGKLEVGIATVPDSHQSNVGVHSISKDHLQSSLKELFKTVKMLAENTLQEIFPSVYHRIQQDYSPFFQSLKRSMESQKKQILPHLLTFHAYAKRMGDKIVQRVYQSYELSNSTHLNVVSFDDIMDEILHDIKPFFSARALIRFRVKRDISENLEVHSVPIEELKYSTKELLKEVKSLTKNALRDILPALYDASVLKSFKDDIEPILKKLILPELGDFKAYVKRIGDKIVRKVYQSYELSNSTHINIVSFDDVIDEVIRNSRQLFDIGRDFSSKLLTNFRVKREAGSFEIEHRYKRSVDEIHSLSLQTIKNSFKELFEAIIAVSKLTLQEMLPSVYDRIQNNFTPMVESFRSDLEPIFKKLLLPRFQNIKVYAKRMGDQIFKKVYKTYELSNSTHLNIVSFDDIMDEIFYDVKPSLERFFTTGLVKNRRVKRDAGVPVSDVPEIILGQLEPTLKSMFASFISMFSDDHNSLTSRVILPTIMDMMNDPETKEDLRKIFWSSKAAFSPLMYEIMNRQSYYNPDGTIVRIPRDKINEARAYFYRETKPIIEKLAEKHLPALLERCSENTPLIFATIDRVRASARGSGGSLRDDFMRFYKKHFAMFKSSTSGHINTYALSEIKQDLKPIEVGVLQVAMDYVDQLENSWLKVFFGRNSLLSRAIFGERETFAVPSGSFSSSARSAPSRGSSPYAVPRTSFQNSGRPAASRGRFFSFAG